MATNVLVFDVRRREPELIRPARPTPHDFKKLSDVDDQEGLRFQIPLIQFYHREPSMTGKDPVQVVRDALARALVYYYPFAGRLRETPGRKLVVECTGEGAMFIEADADVRLEQFGQAIHPPFPCLQELFFDVPRSAGDLDCPLLLIQVTRLKCGGFIFTLQLSHTLSDGQGLAQFMNAVEELARGATCPSVLPVWQRELLHARNPPRVTFPHREYEEVADTRGTIIPPDDMVHRSFLFSRKKEITAIRRCLPWHLQNCTTFEVLTACLWRCRTVALQPDPDEEMRLICVVNARAKFDPPLPEGYYGNVIALPAAVSTAAMICGNPLGYSVELVRKAKKDVNEEYMRSTADLMVARGRPHFTVERAFMMSDLTKVGFGETDLGWGKPVYGGPVKGGVESIPWVISFFSPFRNHKGEEGIVVPISLRAPAMERFVEALDNILKGHEGADDSGGAQASILSAI